VYHGNHGNNSQSRSIGRHFVFRISVFSPASVVFRSFVVIRETSCGTPIRQILSFRRVEPETREHRGHCLNRTFLCNLRAISSHRSRAPFKKSP
jgi:hypothetical protein